MPRVALAGPIDAINSLENAFFREWVHHLLKEPICLRALHFDLWRRFALCYHLLLTCEMVEQLELGLGADYFSAFLRSVRCLSHVYN